MPSETAPLRSAGSPLLGGLPMLQWGRTYDRSTFIDDGVAALIVTLMLIPQSLAYAMLAGLPAQAGLYASIAPLLAYAVFGSSRVLAVGPVAVISLMTATAVGTVAVPGTAEHAAAALTLAALSGAVLLIMGALRLGFVAHFLSHPVTSGFITASAILIAAGQLKTLLGVKAEGHTLPQILASVGGQWSSVHGLTLAVGAATTVFLFWARSGVRPALTRRGVSARTADLVAKAAPVGAIVLSTALSWGLDWQASGLKVVGAIPAGLPPLTWPQWDADLWRALAMPAVLISIVGFVESVSVGQTLAARRRERIEPNRELVALGAANLSAACTGGFPVTGGFSRSVVNAEAGARTPAAGVFTAAGILLASLFLTPALRALPLATLAATIVVAVLSLADLGALKHTWEQGRADFAALLVTLVSTLVIGVETGLAAGVLVSLALHLLRTSRPHIAEVGRIPGTEHFRNVLRHETVTHPALLSLRIDESLYFANARTLEDHINAAVSGRPELVHVVLQCSAVNDIDASAQDSLQAIDQRLREGGMTLHLSEVKGPVMDRLTRSGFLEHLSGRVFLTHHQAVEALTPVGSATTRSTGAPAPDSIQTT